MALSQNMDSAVKLWRSTFLLALVLASSLLPSLVAAQSVTPTSMIPPDGVAGTDSELQLAFGWHRPDSLRYRITSLVSASGFRQQPPFYAGNFTRVFSNTTNQITPDFVAFISCDSSSSSNSSAVDTLALTIDRNPIAAILYSNTQSGCSYIGGNRINPSYTRLYTMTMANSNDTFINYARDVSNRVTLGQKRQLDSNSSDVPTTSSSGGGGGGGTSPSTAVAMIILYSITGVITALFLIIIVTGAIRAHRHPERYGPRNALGRPRQSRARGLARAMLETLPIVKFGEKTDLKPTDVELAATGATTNAKNIRDSTLTENEGEKGVLQGESQDISPNGEQSTTRNEELAAVAQPDDALGCSICTDDFEIGQDVRVLPCDHHFHPACIDPWLLNVSGTCPLCRIDLRPTGTADDNGNAVAESEIFPPPLDPTEQSRRASRRHSLIWDVLNPNRMRDASAQERIAALRRVREERRMTPTEETEARRTRRLTARLQDVFHIRTTPTSTTQTESLAVPGDTNIANTSHRSSAIGRIPEVSTEAENNAAAISPASPTGNASDWPASRPRSEATASSPVQPAAVASQGNSSSGVINATSSPATTRHK